MKEQKIQLTKDVISLYSEAKFSLDAKIKWVYYCQGIKAGLVLTGANLDTADRVVARIELELSRENYQFNIEGW